MHSHAHRQKGEAACGDPHIDGEMSAGVAAGEAVGKAVELLCEQRFQTSNLAGILAVASRIPWDFGRFVIYRVEARATQRCSINWVRQSATPCRGKERTISPLRRPVLDGGCLRV